MVCATAWMDSLFFNIYFLSAANLLPFSLLVMNFPKRQNPQERSMTVSWYMVLKLFSFTGTS